MRCRDLFIAFFKVGLLTVGGGYAMIPVIREAVVEKQKWLTDKEFIDSLALSQSAPGSMAINSAAYIGYRLRGFRGAVASTLGSALPSFLIILTVSLFFFDLRENVYVGKIFKGIRAAVVSMIALSLLQLLKVVKFKLGGYMVFAVSGFLLVKSGVNPVWLLLTGGIGGILYFNLRGEV